MKKLFVLLLCAGFFTACNNDNLGIDDPLNNNGYEFNDTNLSVMEVLSSAEAWHISDICYYTEPNGKGDVYKQSEDVVGIGSSAIYTVSKDVMTTYVGLMPPEPDYYKQSPFIETEDNVYIIGDDGEYYWKVIKYDESKLLIEGNTKGVYIGGVDNPYSVFYLEKTTPTKPNWKEKYIPYEEYLKYKESNK